MCVCVCVLYLLNAIGYPPGGSSTVHIYTKTIHRTTKIHRIKQIIHRKTQIILLIILIIVNSWRLTLIDFIIISFVPHEKH